MVGREKRRGRKNKEDKRSEKGKKKVERSVSRDGSTTGGVLRRYRSGWRWLGRVRVKLSKDVRVDTVLHDSSKVLDTPRDPDLGPPPDGVMVF